MGENIKSRRDCGGNVKITSDASNLIKEKSLENDLIITMGAGNITNIWDQLQIANNNMTSLTNLAA